MKMETKELATKIVEYIQDYQKKNAEYPEYKILTEKERNEFRERQKDILINIVDVLLIIYYDLTSIDKNEKTEKEDLKNDFIVFDLAKMQEKILNDLIKKSEKSEKVQFIMELLSKS